MKKQILTIVAMYPAAAFWFLSPQSMKHGASGRQCTASWLLDFYSNSC